MKEQLKKHVDKYGTIRWKLSNGLCHREDGPAVIYADSTKAWYYQGKQHRVDGPAVILPDGIKIWCYHGKHHRIDGPATIFPNGSPEYWFMGEHVHEGDFEYTLIRRKEAQREN